MTQALCVCISTPTLNKMHHFWGFVCKSFIMLGLPQWAACLAPLKNRLKVPLKNTTTHCQFWNQLGASNLSVINPKLHNNTCFNRSRIEEPPTQQVVKGNQLVPTSGIKMATFSGFPVQLGFCGVALTCTMLSFEWNSRMVTTTSTTTEPSQLSMT